MTTVPRGLRGLAARHTFFLSCPVLSCPVLSCPVLSCPVLSCPVLSCLSFLALTLSATVSTAHNVTPGDAGYIQEIWGVKLAPFMYLGAKHMVTGYDHLLFLFGVVFFLYRMQHVAIYVGLFAIGHCTTILAGGRPKAVS